MNYVSTPFSITTKSEVMTSRFKIQSILSKALFFILLAFMPYMVMAQCPKAIVCDNLGLGLQYDAIPSDFNSANAYFDFGVGDGRNGYYSASVYPYEPAPIRNTLYYSIPNCSSGLRNLKITFNDKNHTYCGSSNSCYDYIFKNSTFFKNLLDAAGFQQNVTGCKEWEGDCGTNGTIYRKGRVTIGEDHPYRPAMLAVSGNVITEQYKVQKCGSIWCDYVFDEGYKLLSLADIERFIKENKHLPKTKSAEEIKKEGGIDAAEVLLNHQEKIEEIFLHLIALDKQLNVSTNNN